MSDSDQKIFAFVLCYADQNNSQAKDHRRPMDGILVRKNWSAGTKIMNLYLALPTTINERSRSSLGLSRSAPSVEFSPLKASARIVEKDCYK